MKWLERSDSLCGLLVASYIRGENYSLSNVSLGLPGKKHLLKRSSIVVRVLEITYTTSLSMYSSEVKLNSASVYLHIFFVDLECQPNAGSNVSQSDGPLEIDAVPVMSRIRGQTMLRYVYIECLEPCCVGKGRFYPSSDRVFALWVDKLYKDGVVSYLSTGGCIREIICKCTSPLELRILGSWVLGVEVRVGIDLEFSFYGGGCFDILC